MLNNEKLKKLRNIAVEETLFEITITTLLGDRTQIKVDKNDTIKLLKLKYYKNKTEYPPPVQRLIALGFLLIDDRTIGSYDIKHSTMIYLVPLNHSPTIYFKTDSDEYLNKYFQILGDHHQLLSVLNIKSNIYTSIPYIPDAVISADLPQEFWKIYGLFFGGKLLENQSKLTYQSFENNLVELQIKTTDGKKWYEENKKIVYDQKCKLLVFGYIRTEIENANCMNIPIEITDLCKMYTYHHNLQSKISDS